MKVRSGGIRHVRVSGQGLVRFCIISVLALLDFNFQRGFLVDMRGKFVHILNQVIDMRHQCKLLFFNNMSLKAELETWAAALKAYEEEDFEKALDLFSRIADSSKILTNMGLIYATLGEHEAAVEQFNAATSLDQYLAVA